MSVPSYSVVYKSLFHILSKVIILYFFILVCPCFISFPDASVVSGAEAIYCCRSPALAKTSTEIAYNS